MPHPNSQKAPNQRAEPFVFDTTKGVWPGWIYALSHVRLDSENNFYIKAKSW
jgi:hypothetical protein